nr:sce7725 family protein [uncultured Pedobacter sp.]
MYLPYLRGKQFELLALRELVSLPLLNTKISPIIEPVKRDLKSIETAIKALNAIDLPVQLIVNPEHGDLKLDRQPIFDALERLSIAGFDNIVPTYLIGNERDFNFFTTTAQNYGFLQSGYSLIHLNQIPSIAPLKALTLNTNLQYNIIHVNHLIALRRGFANGRLGFLSDPFIRQKRNADYENLEDEIFSSDCFFYISEGFAAFSDYLTIGSDYIDGGMLPYAVVIHLTYKDPHNDDIRIKHFLSDSNQDASDTAGKFYEALHKLIAFIDQENIDSIACVQFRDYYNRGAFPGLGVIKKLSIMHHLELVQGLI